MDRRRVLVDRIVAWSPALLLAGLAALTYWLDAQIQPQAPRTDGSKRHDPDLFLQDFRALTFDAAGNLRESLTAKRAEHYPDDDSTLLTAPTLLLTQTGHPALSVTANQGIVAGDRDSGEFKGDVRVVREADSTAAGKDASGPVTLTTESLHVQANEQRVDTRAAVTIVEPRGIIRGRGLTYDNKTHILHIDSNVSGSLAPRALPQ
ncbi:MAG TPA: LPS export ABC transporter periplasmic protein LptC [Casimicrobiaceae bacterium]|jgi:LPS export ABC transporter protein LptC|nr:LPS export ABC transporter periplasmic protein LptC [Casimicrobiaceae bacterium]